VVAARVVAAVRVLNEETMEMTLRAAVVAQAAVAARVVAVAGKVSAQGCRDCSRRRCSSITFNVLKLPSVIQLKRWVM